MKPLFSLLQLPAVETAASLNPDPTQQPFGRPRPSNRLSSRRSLGLRLHTEPAFIQEATAVPEPPPPPLQNHTRPDDRNTLSSEVSHHPSVLAGHLPISAATPVSADPASLVQAVQPRSVQQPVSFEPMNRSSLHRPACASAVNTDVFCQDGRPQEHSTTHQ